MLGHREYTPHDLETVRRIMVDSGAAGVLEKEEAELADRAKSILKEFPANVYRKCLLELVDYLIEPGKINAWGFLEERRAERPPFSVSAAGFGGRIRGKPSGTARNRRG